mmetsp:Transcript_15837/g.41637  ORF Transcript_15837/g.41637 Transcript_15837/m.41637 type:complete len:206 (-) Transcript_15837:635-1252(-)
MVPTPNPNALENKIRMAEVEKHTKEGDAWMVIGNMKTCPETGPKVYNVSEYLDDHPGGAEVMLDVAGKDADTMFEDIGHSKQARKTLEKFLIGVLEVPLYTRGLLLPRLLGATELLAPPCPKGNPASFLHVACLFATPLASPPLSSPPLHSTLLPPPLPPQLRPPRPPRRRRPPPLPLLPPPSPPLPLPPPISSPATTTITARFA